MRVSQHTNEPDMTACPSLIALQSSPRHRHLPAVFFWRFRHLGWRVEYNCLPPFFASAGQISSGRLKASNGRAEPIRRSAAVVKPSRSNVRTFNRAGLFHVPVASHALRLRQPRSGGGDRLKPLLKPVPAPLFAIFVLCG